MTFKKNIKQLNVRKGKPKKDPKRKKKNTKKNLKKNIKNLHKKK